ncbi:MAG TPA: ABC transporter permease [Candidatus Polarisedimenticolia bacterium]|nr:ABC transporter permease [Candidatus Polarisedimenticolia bacterium]
MGTLRQDLRYAVRMLAKHPGFTLIAVLSLALGIGANTTVFTWISAILLDPLPAVSDAGRLVIPSFNSRNYSDLSLSYADYVDYRDRNSVFSGILVHDMEALSLGFDDKAERIWGEVVSGNYFDVLGVRPALGRAFLPEEDATPGTHPVVVLSHGLWRTRFGGDPGTVGRTIDLNNRPFTVVGIAPEGFQGTEVGLDLDAWVPMMMHELIQAGGDRLKERGNHWLDSVARLKPGVSLAQAEAEMRTLAEHLNQEYPDSNDGIGVSLYPLWRSPEGAPRVLGPVLFILMAVVGIVLLIACANVANLLLVRAAGRQREIAIRLSLGAGRGRLIRQLLTESILLALMGGILAVVMALWTSDAIKLFIPRTPFPVSLSLAIDRSVLGFTLLVSVLTGIVFGLVPALQASRPDLVRSLKQESTTTTGGRRKGRLRNILVASQVALSLVLLIAAGLFLRSLQQARTMDPGFNPGNVLLASIDLFPNGYEAEEGRQLYDQIREQVGALPGVESVSLARRTPLGLGGTSSGSMTVVGYTPAEGETPFAFYNMIGPDYFRTMEIPLAHGREFTPQDRFGAAGVLIVNETLATRYWPGEDPIGRQLSFGEDPYAIVGVARDIKYHELNDAAVPYVYFPVLQFFRADMTLHVRTTGDPESFAGVVRHTIAGLDPDLPVFGVMSLEAAIAPASIQQRIAGSLLGVFGFLALVLAAIGLYGVLSYAAGQRTQEIGIRMALGAQRRDALRLILGQGMFLASIGLAGGLVISFALTRLLSGVLYGVSPTDPGIFLGVAALLGLVALCACYVPARRAARVDPLVALRYE